MLLYSRDKRWYIDFCIIRYPLEVSKYFRRIQIPEVFLILSVSLWKNFAEMGTNKLLFQIRLYVPIFLTRPVVFCDTPSTFELYWQIWLSLFSAGFWSIKKPLKTILPTYVLFNFNFNCQLDLVLCILRSGCTAKLEFFLNSVWKFGQPEFRLSS